jgi:pimeloyl-ACP methyl ester carboxylesterase
MRRRMSRAVRGLLGGAAGALLLAACSSTPAGSGVPTTVTPTTPTVATASAQAWSAPGPSTVPSFYDPPSPLPAAPHGTLIRVQLVTGVPGVPADAKLWRILYHSTSVTGTDVAVSGYVVVPDRAAPAGGYPVIAWAHGTTGLARTCGPSLFSEAPDAAGIYLAPDLDSYVASGYVVAATDYQGLGGPGVHPYLVGDSEGENVLDAAIAAGQLPGVHLSNAAVIVGHSQGGQAALFAGQLAPAYAPRLHVVGTVGIAPLTEASTALPLAVAIGELSLIASAAYAWANNYPQLKMSDVFQPAAIPQITQLESTQCLGAVSSALAGKKVSSVLLPNFAKTATMKQLLQANTPGLVHTDSPMLILQGIADSTIPAFLAETFESSQCPAVHDDLALRLYPGATHSTVLIASAKDMLAWIAQRFAGKPVASGCSSSTVSG